MSERINCNFARVAIRHFSSKHLPSSHRFPKGSIPKILAEYNSHFVDNKNLQETYNKASKKFPVICQLFNRQWNPTETRVEYLMTFSVTAWKKLSPEEKQQHTLQKCKACETQFQALSAAFPCKAGKKKKPVVAFTEKELSSPRKFGRKALRDLNKLTEQSFGKPIQNVLSEMPRSRLSKKPTSDERKDERRKMERKIRDEIQQDKDKHGDQLVLQNRISWSAYNKIRLTEGLAATPKRKRQEDEEDLPTTKKKHGCKAENLAINTDQLIQEARTWSPTEQINWSQLGQRYGLTAPNRGQIIKEFLQEHNIPAASVAQRTTCTPRRPKKKFKGGRISFPMYKPVSFEKQKIQDKVKKNEVSLGDEVVVSTFNCYKIDPDDNTITEEHDEVSARRIPLLEIRKKLLQKHEELGVIRNQPNEYFDTLEIEEVKHRLFELHESFDPCDTIEVLQEKLKKISHQRFFKVWHDHATVCWTWSLPGPSFMCI